MKCKVWSKGKNRQGYGQRWYKGKNVLAHRAAYCDAHGLALEDIKGQLVRHKCDNPPCVNPDHLELGTHKDNARDCIERGRRASGRRSGRKALPKELAFDVYQDKLAEGRDNKTAILITACQLGVSEVWVRRTISLYAG